MLHANLVNNVPDYAKAIDHALLRLHDELPAYLCYHNVQHTAMDVLPAVRRLAKLDGLNHADAALLDVAAAYHDIGYIRRIEGHEAISIVIMSEALPGFGFSSEQIDSIALMILCTRNQQKPRNELARLLVDADLDYLGRSDFMACSTALWQEQNKLGFVSTWNAWLQAQVEFLRQHHYFTATARALRDAGKQHNIQLLEEQCKG